MERQNIMGGGTSLDLSTVKPNPVRLREISLALRRLAENKSDPRPCFTAGCLVLDAANAGGFYAGEYVIVRDYIETATARGVSKENIFYELVRWVRKQPFGERLEAIAKSTGQPDNPFRLERKTLSQMAAEARRAESWIPDTSDRPGYWGPQDHKPPPAPKRRVACWSGEYIAACFTFFAFMFEAAARGAEPEPTDTTPQNAASPAAIGPVERQENMLSSAASLRGIVAELREAQRRFPLWRTFVDSWGEDGPEELYIPRWEIHERDNGSWVLQEFGKRWLAVDETCDQSKVDAWKLDREAYWEFQGLAQELVPILARRGVELCAATTAGASVLFWALGNEFPPERARLVCEQNTFWTVARKLEREILSQGNAVGGGSVSAPTAAPQHTAYGQRCETAGRATAAGAGGSPGVSDVFLAHNSKDKPTVRRLKKRLEAKGISVWLDEDMLRPGVPSQPLLESGMKTSRSVAVLVGKDGLGPWEDEEMQAALVLAVKDKRPVIPVLLPGVAARPELPMFLAIRTWVDLREGLTETELEKLVWGITGEKP